MPIIKKYFLFLMCFLSLSVYAEEDPLHLTAMLGIANVTQNDATFDLTSDETELLTQTNEQAWNAWSAQLGAGYAVPLGNEKWFTQIIPQLNFYVLNNATLEGQVHRFNDVSDNDAAYDMDFNSTRFMLDGALTVVEYKALSVYALAGLGIAWSDVDLAMNPYDSDLVPLQFNSPSQTGFAYEFGAGMTYPINRDATFVLQYLYTTFNDVEISGTSDDFTAENSDLTINSQTISIGLILTV